MQLDSLSFVTSYQFICSSFTIINSSHNDSLTYPQHPTFPSNLPLIHLFLPSFHPLFKSFSHLALNQLIHLSTHTTPHHVVSSAFFPFNTTPINPHLPLPTISTISTISLLLNLNFHLILNYFSNPTQPNRNH
jgi:hypothetical protein